MALVRHRAFILLWAGQSISQLADWAFRTVALVWVFTLTHSGTATGAVGLAEALPFLIAGPLAGAVADRTDRTAVAALTTAARAVLLLPLLLLTPQPWLLLVVVVAATTLAQFTFSGTAAALPVLVGEEQLGQANALLSLTNGLIFGIGPGAAAACFAFLGADPTIILIVALYLPAAICLRFVRAPSPSREGVQTRILADLRDGVAFVRRSPFLLAILLVVFIALLGFGALSVLDVVFANRILRAGSSGVGVLLTASGIGETMGAVTVTACARFLRHRYHRVLGFSVIMQGLGFLAYGLAPNLLSAAGVLVAVGFLFAPLQVAFMTLIQQGTEDSYMGRVIGLVNMVVAVALILSMAWGGVLSDRVNVRQLLAGVACFSVVAGMCTLRLVSSMPVTRRLSEEGEAVVVDGGEQIIPQADQRPA